jgi:hypothetical protein
MSNESNSTGSLRRSLIRLAHDHPELREQLLPVLRAAGLSQAQVSQSVASVVSSLSEASRFLQKVRDHVDRRVGTALAGSIATLVGTIRAGRLAAWQPAFGALNPADVAEEKRRSLSIQRSIQLSDDIRDALKAKGWRYTQGHTDSNTLAYDHEEIMSFTHRELGILSVKLFANDDGK